MSPPLREGEDGPKLGAVLSPFSGGEVPSECEAERGSLRSPQEPPLPTSSYTKGLAITAVGGIALTVDIPLIRLAAGDVWSIMLSRSVMTLIGGLVIWTVLRAATGRSSSFVPGRSGLLIVLIYGIAGLCFIGAVFNTSTADLVFILAFNTVFSSVLSWLMLNQRPQNATLIAMAAMLVGVLVIVAGGLGTGNMLGNLLALANAFLLALALTLTHGSDRDMGLTSITSTLFPLVLGAWMTGGTVQQLDAPWWIVLNGLIVMPIAYYCLAAGPRWISGPEVAMFYLLETVLAPVWVWMIFDETPANTTLIGGGILLAALVAHTLWQLTSERAGPAPAH